MSKALNAIAQKGDMPAVRQAQGLNVDNLID